MTLKDLINEKIKLEITNDPEKLGYAGKTDAEIMAILNNPVTKQRVVEDVSTAPINRILAGIADTPNVINEVDVTDAKK